MSENFNIKEGSSQLDFIYKAMIERDPNKRRIKPVDRQLLTEIAGLSDSSEDSDFRPNEDDSDAESLNSSLHNGDNSQVSNSSDEDYDTNNKPNDVEIDNNHDVTDKPGPKILICMVCLSDNRKSNAEYMVECDICGLVVHETCYGILPSGVALQSIKSNATRQNGGVGHQRNQDGGVHHRGAPAPSQIQDGGGNDGDNDSQCSSYSTEPWFCEPCRARVSAPSCQLCPDKGVGAFKETDVRSWVHLVCALYVPGIAFAEVEHLSLVTLFEVNYRRFGERECAYCEDPILARTGICIKCDSGMCRTFFHVTCGQREGLLVENFGANSDALSPESAYFAFCKSHYGNKELRESRKRDAIYARSIQYEVLKGTAKDADFFSHQRPSPLSKSADSHVISPRLRGSSFLDDGDFDPNKVRSRLLMKLARSRVNYDADRTIRLAKYLGVSPVGQVVNPWVPPLSQAHNYARPLTSDPEFCRAVLARTKLRGVHTVESMIGYGTFLDLSSPPAKGVRDFSDNLRKDDVTLGDVIGNGGDSYSRDSSGRLLSTPPSFTPRFVEYFKGRESEIQKLNQEIQARCRDIEAFTARKVKLQVTWETADKLNRDSCDTLQRTSASIIGIWNALCSLKGKMYPLPRRFMLEKVEKKTPASLGNLPGIKKTFSPPNPAIPSDRHGSSPTSVRCRVCGTGESLKYGGTNPSDVIIKCDTCEMYYHLGCHEPPLRKRPVVSKFYTWQCSLCTAKEISSSTEEVEEEGENTLYPTLHDGSGDGCMNNITSTGVNNPRGSRRGSKRLRECKAPDRFSFSSWTSPESPSLKRGGKKASPSPKKGKGSQKSITKMEDVKKVFPTKNLFNDSTIDIPTNARQLGTVIKKEFIAENYSTGTPGKRTSRRKMP